MIIKSISVVFLLVAGQTLWKIGMNQIGELAYNFSFFYKMLINPYILMGFLVYGVATIVWLGVLSSSELSKAFPIMSLSYVLVLIPAYFIFKEPITLNKVVSIMLIISGLIFLYRK